LMVGIGGGAPSPTKDIQLGDVIVSSPSSRNGDVFQYNFSKTIQNQSFQETRFLDQPPIVLRAAVSKLRETYDIKGHQLAEHISEALKKIKKRKKYLRPPPAGDRLYRPNIVHPTDSSAGCDTTCANDTASLQAVKNETKRTIIQLSTTGSLPAQTS
jgi:hypothetical protein